MYHPATLYVSTYQWSPFLPSMRTPSTSSSRTVFQRTFHLLKGWQETNGEWQWIEDDPNYVPPIMDLSTVIIDSSVSGMHSSAVATTTGTTTTTTTTPKLPSGTYKPKQSLGQNYLKDPNTVAKIIRAFHTDATTLYDANGQKKKKKGKVDGPVNKNDVDFYIVELGPGAGALTDPLIAQYGVDTLHCIEIDVRSIELLRNKHPKLHIDHLDVLQINYNTIVQRRRTLQKQKHPSIHTSIPKRQNEDTDTHPISNPSQVGHVHDVDALNVIGNLPYYITSQILFALVDATHQGLIRSATITMQYEVGQRMLAHPCTKEYVFYPQPKVNSILLGLHFVTPYQLQQERLCGVHPSQLRRVITKTFQQRRKTIRNSIKSLLQEIYDNNTTQIDDIMNLPPLPVPSTVQELANQGNAFAIQQTLLPNDWSTKRPEEIHPAQFIELTRLLYSGRTNQNNSNLLLITDDDENGDEDNVDPAPYKANALGTKVWRKLKHGD